MTTVETRDTALLVEEAPVTFAQRSLLAPESAINVPSVVVLSDPVDLARVRQVLATVTARHGALRSELTAGSDDGRQIVRADGQLRLYRFHHDATASAGLAEALRAGSHRPFTVDGGRLAQADLHVFSDRAVLVVWLHHAISDLVTSQVLGAELAALWRGEALPPPSGQMAQYARYERDLEPSPQDWEFWTRTLSDVDDELGVGYPCAAGHLMLRPPLPRLDPDLVDALQRLATAGRTTLTAVLAAAVIANHAPAAQRDKVLIGLTISNRDHPRWRTTSLAYRPRIDDGELAGEIEGDAQLHDDAAVAGFGEQFCAVLSLAARYPDRPIQTLAREASS